MSLAGIIWPVAGRGNARLLTKTKGCDEQFSEPSYKALALTAAALIPLHAACFHWACEATSCCNPILALLIPD